MDSILKAFSIGFILRSVFSGIFFVVSYYLASHGSLDFTSIGGKSSISVTLLVALFGGVTIYGLHRSLLYPLVEWFFNSEFAQQWRKLMPLISTSTIDTLLWRWDQGTQQPPIEDCTGINEHLNTWADFIHLQFNSSLCIALGVFIGVSSAPGTLRSCNHLIGFAGLLFLAAFVSNWRSHSVLDYIKNRPNSKMEPSICNNPEELKTLREQLGHLNERSRWYSTQLWQLPFAYIGATGFVLASLSSHYTRHVLMAYGLFAGILGLIVLWHTIWVKKGEAAAISKLQAVEMKLGLSEEVRAEDRDWDVYSMIAATAFCALAYFCILFWALLKM